MSTLDQILDKATLARRISRLGGEGILSEDKAMETGIGVLRVLDLMSDWGWHSADEICRAASGGEGYATEGLRRMRELRNHDFSIERKQRGPGTWYYKISRGIR